MVCRPDFTADAHAPQGFQRVADNLEDTCLDNPRAREEFPAIVAAAHRDGWLDSSFEARKPALCHERGRISIDVSRGWPCNGSHDTMAVGRR